MSPARGASCPAPDSRARACRCLAPRWLQNPVLAVLAIAMASFCGDLTMPHAWAATMDMGGRYSGTLSGAMNSWGNLGGAISPMVIGYVLQWTGSNWNLTFYVASAVYACGILCWMFLDSTTPIEGVAAQALRPVMNRPKACSTSRRFFNRGAGQSSDRPAPPGGRGDSRPSRPPTASTSTATAMVSGSFGFSPYSEAVRPPRREKVVQRLGLGPAPRDHRWQLPPRRAAAFRAGPSMRRLQGALPTPRGCRSHWSAALPRKPSRRRCRWREDQSQPAEDRRQARPSIVLARARPRSAAFPCARPSAARFASTERTACANLLRHDAGFIRRRS